MQVGSSRRRGSCVAPGLLVLDADAADGAPHVLENGVPVTGPVFVGVFSCLNLSVPKYPCRMDRRAFVQSSSAFALQLLGIAGCSVSKRQTPAATPNATAPNLVNALPFYDVPGPIIPIRADLDRIFRITVCLRPFRAAGPRQDIEIRL